MDKRLKLFLDRAETFFERLERSLPAARGAPDWDSAQAFRWRHDGARRYLQAVPQAHRLRLRDLRCIDVQVAQIERNTRQFVQGHPANNVLLWGSRGTGKSSLVKALLNEYQSAGLRLIEVEKHDLIDLPDIVEAIDGRPERFVLFCDDLSFEKDDPSFKSLKAIIDGTVAAPPDNVLIYATSNRRHLLPEFHSENLEARNIDGEIHHGEAVEEKISLSERFGLWLSFHPFSQDQYLEIVRYWLGQMQAPAHDLEEVRTAALRWALTRGSRSGRVAWQFARDCAGRLHLES